MPNLMKSKDDRMFITYIGEMQPDEREEIEEYRQTWTPPVKAKEEEPPYEFQNGFKLNDEKD